MSFAWRASAALSLAALACGCLSRSTQRWPGPMRATRPELPPGDSALHPPGPEEVSVVRHADPVQVRPVGALQGYPLSFYDKRARLTAGGAVVVSPGGRAEVLWPTGSSVVLFGEAIGWVGSPSRGEALFEFQELDRVRIELHEGDQVRLLGGSLLTGSSGPYMVQHGPDGTLSVHNQSKGAVQVAFREETFELAPGQTVRLPLLSSGGQPLVDDPQLERFSGPGFNLRLAGDPECAESEGGVRVRAPADRECEARGLGVRVKLGPGESALFSEPRPAPPASALPEPARGAATAPESTPR